MFFYGLVFYLYYDRAKNQDGKMDFREVTAMSNGTFFETNFVQMRLLSYSVWPVSRFCYYWLYLEYIVSVWRYSNRILSGLEGAGFNICLG